MADPTPPRKPLRPCPICQKTATERDRPFCSPRCAEIDLGRWFGETYRIAGPPQEAAANDTDDEMTG